MASWEEFKGSLFAAGRDVSQKAKEMSEITKLKLDIRSKEDFIEKQFANIGRAYYEANKEDASEKDAEQFAVIAEAMEEVVRMKQQVLMIQGAEECPKCGKKVPEGTSYCSECGTKINDMFEED